MKSRILVCIVIVISSFLSAAYQLQLSTCKRTNFNLQAGGFGTPAPKINKSNSPSQPSSAQSLEISIQNRIDKIAGLREAMSLQEQVNNYDIATSNLDASQISPGATDAQNKRLTQLKELDFNRDKIHTLLQQITWDESASLREERYDKAIPKSKSSKKRNGKSMPGPVISNEVQQHMKELSQIIGNDKVILDVGCGSGLLYDFLDDMNEDNYHGVDLSLAMISIARKKLPNSHLTHGDFMSFDKGINKYDVVIFNECLHYMLEPYVALQKAVDMVEPSSLIIISHPKGYEHVSMMRNKNGLLVPSLLPTAQDIQEQIENIQELLVVPSIKASQYLAVLKK